MFVRMFLTICTKKVMPCIRLRREWNLFPRARGTTEFRRIIKFLLKSKYSRIANCLKLEKKRRIVPRTS